MRTVLHLINTGGPGGAETVFVDLVRGLDARRWRSIPVVPDQGWINERLRECGTEPVVVPTLRPFEVGYYARLARLARAEGVDVVHGHYFGPAVTASIVGMLTGIPAVATLHGAGDVAGERHRALKSALLGRGLRRIVFVSEALRREVTAGGALRAARTEVIPNGIDAGRFSPRRDPALRRELGIGDDAFVVAAIGNVRPAKGYDVLLRAAALLRARVPGLRVVIAGEARGPVFDELVALRASLGLKDVATFAGFRDDVAGVLAAADAFVLASRSEGFSLSTVQAMAMGIPVAATRCGGPEELVDDGVTGLLVENGSPGAIADAIATLHADAAMRARLGAAGMRAARERFTVEAQVRAYERLYDAVLAERRGFGRRAAPAEIPVPAAAPVEGGAAWRP
ncbi:glycosyltransferase [Longimicrobium sp.]|uniref:glycosyltransferase n=1 Tax=Longimicrobium sp. TaxID=2029185 RepID=UPI002C5AF35E|nr:glycosyltransferase [Longimicrobium sp.]HSU13290.1 glycosyltransferase [Longimicrobium sp.]